jgi:6-phosphogluconolactonase (cycloisomerase 2 family)
MSDEKAQASPSGAQEIPPGPQDATIPPGADPDSHPDDGYDYHPPTDSFPSYEPAPVSYPSQPQWSTPTPTVVRLRLRDHLLVAFSMVLTLALVSAIGFMWFGDVFSVQRTAGEMASTGDTADSMAGQGAAKAAAVDLREAAVFVASNDAKGNEVAAFARNEDGTLSEVGRYQTGGKGSGTLEDVSQALVLGSASGEASPVHNVDKAELLFVPNSGSNTISVFRVMADRLELASEVPSGGEKPISLTVNNGLLYVLNSGEYDDRFIIGPTMVLENCTTGQGPSVSGFRVAADGVLTPIEGSNKPLTGTRDSGCAQIVFSPDGKTLIATERRAEEVDEESGFPKGAITTFGVKENGTLGPGVVTEPTGNGPYGVTFTKDGTILMAEQDGADKNPNGGTVSSYSQNADGTLEPIGDEVATQGTDTCWIVVTEDDKLAFASAPLGGGSIASLRVGKGGKMELLHPSASAADGQDMVNDNVADGVLDLGLSRDSKYLYALDAFAGGIYGFQVNGNGTLTFIERTQVFDILPIPEGGSGGPNGIAAF